MPASALVCGATHGVLAQRRRGAAAYGNASKRVLRLSILKIIRAGDAAMLCKVGSGLRFIRSIQKASVPRAESHGKTSTFCHTIHLA